MPRLSRFLMLAAGLIALLFSDALVSGRVLSQTNLLFRAAPWSAHVPADVGATNTLLGDVPAVITPFLHEVARQLREGRLPVWSPRLFGGHPLLASFQSAIFSPFTWPAIVLPVADALLAAAILKLLMGGLGMWLLLRRFGLAPGAVLAGAVAYLLNPFSVVWIEHPLSAVAAWLPWLLWSLDRLVASGTWRDAALTAGVSALAVLAGHPETTYKVGLLTVPYAIVCAWQGGHMRRLVTRVVPAAVAALAITMVQVLPFVEYLRASGVFAMRQALGRNPYPAPLETLVTAIVPNFFGNPSRGLYLPMENAFGVPSNFCEQQIYAGIAVWILAAVGVVCGWREWRVRFCATGAALAALLMYGVPGFGASLRLAARRRHRRALTPRPDHDHDGDRAGGVRARRAAAARAQPAGGRPGLADERRGRAGDGRGAGDVPGVGARVPACERPLRRDRWLVGVRNRVDGCRRRGHLARVPAAVEP